MAVNTDPVDDPVLLASPAVHLYSPQVTAAGVFLSQLELLLLSLCVHSRLWVVSAVAPRAGCSHNVRTEDAAHSETERKCAC